MVTLIGFFFILADIALLVIFMPDLVGPVRLRATKPHAGLDRCDSLLTTDRLRDSGPLVALLQLRIRALHVPDHGQP